MRILKKIMGVLLIGSMCFSSTGIRSTAASLDASWRKPLNFCLEKEYAELFLSKMGHASEISNPVPLKNFKNEMEAVCFTINNGGYIIINTNDLSVPELSFKNKNPFSDSKKTYVYNGPLTYMEIEGDKLFDSKAKTEINDKTKAKYKYFKNKVNKDRELSQLKQITLCGTEKDLEPLTLSSGGELKTALKTWFKPGGYCGPIAAAIVAMYMDEVRDDNYVAASNENPGLIDVMISYIGGSCGSTAEQLRSGFLKYIVDQGIQKTTVVTSDSFYFSTIKERIDDFAVPVIIDTDNHPTYGEHWITCHGYYDYNSGYDYVKVNDGWGSNDVWVKCDSYLDDLVFVTP